jgi:8-oxo-dGTP diphosphatase
MDPHRNLVSVTAAILIKGDKVFIAQRKSTDHLAGKWEFPGGKIEPGETPEACLRRELQEEFGIDTQIGHFLAESVYHYEKISIRLLAYQATLSAGTLAPNDHDAIAWVAIHQLDQYDFAPADVPFVKMLKGGQIAL